MRTTLALLLALLVAACVEATPPGAPILARDATSDRIAVYAPGARSVRVLLVRPPSIVLLREVFVPADEAITCVRWSGADLIIDTTDERLALDTRTWTLAARPTARADATARARARFGG